jgi:hypothetical protein
VPEIIETIVTTMAADGTVHIAPLGLIRAEPDPLVHDGSEAWTIAPFAPSRTLDNLRAVPFACASHTDDVRLYAGGVTGRKSWPVVPATRVQGARLADCVSHMELAVVKVDEHAERPRFICRVEAHTQHRPWRGMNRAQAAVVEGAILVSRLHMLPPEKVESELAYLGIAIAKTAGPVEAEAWSWIMERIDRWRSASITGGGAAAAPPSSV